MTKVVVLDASVPYPSLCRNVLMHLAEQNMIAARWTTEIHDEWTRNLLHKQPNLSPERVGRTRTLMDAAVPDAYVSGYEELIPNLSLPDPNDRHVLAAAITANAEAIVTFNLRHFPPAHLYPHALKAVTPDELLCQLLDDQPEWTATVLHAVQTSFENLPYTWTAFLERLQQTGFHTAVQKLSS